jgi:HEAT repeat protein
VRADACHLLGLTGSAEARENLRARLQDPNAEVREIAAEALAALEVHA